MTEDPATRNVQEPSMEDILASIRRVLAEDGGLASPEPTHSATTRPAPDAEKDCDSPPGDESTTGRRSPANDAPFVSDSKATRPAGAEPGADLQDVFMLSPDIRASGNPLVSHRAAEETTDVLSQLARAILDRRDVAIASRDVTLEGMVREMLRPLLREWLDRNLPYLIERLVKKEIDVMINRAERLED